MGKCHLIHHEVKDQNAFVISLNDDVFFWRPNLEVMVFDYMNIKEIIEMINDLESDKKWRSEKHRKDLINHWREIYQIMREIRIEKFLEPEIDYNSFILTC
jgi:hypothetical protein